MRTVGNMSTRTETAAAAFKVTYTDHYMGNTQLIGNPHFFPPFSESLLLGVA
jgi:hypothetical protein